MKKITFCKMHGLGNDFMVIDAITQPLKLEQLPIRLLSDRNRGVGFDQLLIIEPSSKADFRCRIYNADASEVENCGNGLRCVARYAQETGLFPQKAQRIELNFGIVEIVIEDYERIRVNMGLPTAACQTLNLTVDGVNKEVLSLALGNPHAILRVDAIKQTPVDSWSTQISNQPAFPEGVNVGFMEIVDRSHIRLRTNERGVGETLACGTNACSAVIAGIGKGWLEKSVSVEVACGRMQIDWGGEGEPVFMTGPAVRVFWGELEV